MFNSALVERDVALSSEKALSSLNFETMSSHIEVSVLGFLQQHYSLLFEF